MSIAIITGSSGLIGSEAVRFFAKKGLKVIGIDNDMRKYFFGEEGSTVWMKENLQNQVKDFIHKNVDIRDLAELSKIFQEYNTDIKLIIHAAAQPSHDWAAKEPYTDFTINANGTLNLLELSRQHCPEVVFEFLSTNKVYGDRPNFLPLYETDKRWEIEETHEFFNGITEEMSIDATKHSLFGASKVAADILVQEYGRYFGLKTACFRGGCLTGPSHSGAELHGFLSYLMKCCVTGGPYTIFGYKGKQVRDNIHSQDLISAFDHFYQQPRCAEVYNIGGGRENSCSILEGIELCEKISGQSLKYTQTEENRIGDHIWYISSLKKFQTDYPDWKITIGLEQTLQEIFELNQDRWRSEVHPSP